MFPTMVVRVCKFTKKKNKNRNRNKQTKTTKTHSRLQEATVRGAAWPEPPSLTRLEPPRPRTNRLPYKEQRNTPRDTGANDHGTQKHKTPQLQIGSLPSLKTNFGPSGACGLIPLSSSLFVKILEGIHCSRLFPTTHVCLNAPRNHLYRSTRQVMRVLELEHWMLHPSGNAGLL